MPSQDPALLNQLRNNVEFASVSQFLHTFQAALEPSRYAQRSSSQTGSRQATPLIEEGPFDTEHFEQMLLDDGERYRLEYLIIRLLKVLTRNRLVSSETWQLYLIREFYKRESEENNPFYQENYWPFPMSKTKIIYEPIDPSSKDGNGDDDAASSVLSEEENDDQPRDSKEPEVKKESDIKTEEQTPEIEAPQEEQPDPINFFDLDLDTKVHVLYILCEWQLDDPERMREHLPSEDDAAHWRVDPVGYDANGNTYWLFDDNRLYRESPAPPKSKSKAKAKGKGSAKKKKQQPPPPPPPVRRGTRRGLRSAGNDTPPPEEEEAPAPPLTHEEEADEEWKPWKMLCISAADWQAFPARFENSKNRDEQKMHQYLTKDLLPQILPILEEREKERKLEQALNNRKRSSRIQIRDLQQQERLRQEVLVQQAFQHQLRHRTTRQDDMAKKKEAEDQAALANSREERLRERELRIQQREMEKAKAISRQEERAAREAARAAAREQEKLLKEQQKAERKLQPAGPNDKDGQAQAPKPVKKRGPRKKKPKVDEDNWTFDCLCGVKGQNLDDGTPMIACGRCGTWAHIACLAKHDKTRKSMKAWENVDYTCRDCLARPPPVTHFTIDHDKERTAEQNTHKRPWIESGSSHHHQTNPIIKFTKPNEGTMGYGPPRVPVYAHHSGGGYSHDGPQRVEINQHTYPQQPIQFRHHSNGHNGQPPYASSPSSAVAPRPPQPQQHQHHHYKPTSHQPPSHQPSNHQQPSHHGYSLPMAPMGHPGFSSQLPPLQSRPPSQPTHNQLPHLNALQPSAGKLPFPSQTDQRPQQHSAFTPLPAPSPPSLPPIHHQVPPSYRPPPMSSAYRPPQDQFPAPHPMPPNQPEQQQG